MDGAVKKCAHIGWNPFIVEVAFSEVSPEKALPRKTILPIGHGFADIAHFNAGYRTNGVKTLATMAMLAGMPTTVMCFAAKFQARDWWLCHWFPMQV